MENYQKNPLKIYIQDIYRAERNKQNKYIYKLFDHTFKNIMIHGVVTIMFNTTESRTNFEISDPTGCVNVYYDTTKNNAYLSESTLKDLVKSLSIASRKSNRNSVTMSALLNSIEKKHKNPIEFEPGSYISVVGDIFVDDLRNIRMVSAYQCKVTSVERDIVWLEELRCLYDKYYLKCDET